MSNPASTSNVGMTVDGGPEDKLRSLEKALVDLRTKYSHRSQTTTHRRLLLERMIAGLHAEIAERRARTDPG